MTSLRILRRILWIAVIVTAAAGATIYAARHAGTASSVARWPAAVPKSLDKIHDYGPAPVLSVQDMQSADFKGHKVLLVFFASWCAPCKLEHPVLMALAKSLPAGTVLWGVDMMDTDSGLAAFLKQDGNPFTKIGLDPSGTAGIDWGVDGIPVTFIIGTDGHLIYRHFGPVDQAEVDGVILPIMRAK